MHKGRIHYYSHRGRRGHPSSLVHRLGTGLLLPIFLVALGAFGATGAFFIAPSYAFATGTLLGALGASILRLLFAYVLALVIGIPLGLLAERNPRLESFLLPIYDVMESIPIIAFFPVIILFFVRSNSLEGAALFMLLFTMVWSIIFSTIGGLKVIPKDVRAAGKVFGLNSFERLRSILLPAIFPSLITGSILALAAGWNVVIVAEALHAYAPQSVNAHDLFGIGSVLVSAATSGDTTSLLTAMGVLVVAIAIINLLVWQPLLARAERYKFE
jgi:NitT/TauT family transport system permease protein